LILAPGCLARHFCPAFAQHAFPGLLCRTGFAASMPPTRFGRARRGFALLTLN
jgi:hypothetical protein